MSIFENFFGKKKEVSEEDNLEKHYREEFPQNQKDGAVEAVTGVLGGEEVAVSEEQQKEMEQQEKFAQKTREYIDRYPKE